MPPAASSRLHPCAKLLSCICYLVCVSAAPPGQPLRLAVLAVLLAACYIVTRTRIGRIASIVLPVALLVGCGVYCGGQPQVLIATGGKIVLCAFAVNLFSLLTLFPDVLSAMRALGAPGLATTLMLMVYTYLHTMSAEGTRTVQAFTFRGRPAPARAFRRYAMLASFLATRAFERSERIGLALKARNFNGELPTKPLQPLRRADALWLAGALFVIALVTFGRI